MGLAPIEERLRKLLSVEGVDAEECTASLYRYAVGELSPEELNEFEAHLATCAACRTDLAAFSESEKAAPARRGFFGLRPAWVALAGVPAMLLLVVGLWWLGVFGPGRQEPAGFRIKGPYQIQLAVKRGSERLVGKSGERFYSGDVLGFFYTAPEPRRLTVLFADERAEITRVYPSRLPAETLPAGVEQPLPDGAVLEPGSGCEWILGIFSVEPIEMDVLEERLSRAVRARKPDCSLGALELENAAIDVIVLRRGNDE
jgi:hypothetical protein